MAAFYICVRVRACWAARMCASVSASRQRPVFKEALVPHVSRCVLEKGRAAQHEFKAVGKKKNSYEKKETILTRD